MYRQGTILVSIFSEDNGILLRDVTVDIAIGEQPARNGTPDG
jgi:hypothetical protein